MLLSMALTGHDTQRGEGGARCGRTPCREAGQRSSGACASVRARRATASNSNCAGKSESPTEQVPTPLIREEAWEGAEEL